MNLRFTIVKIRVYLSMEHGAFKHTEETKRKMSESKKELYRQHPEKHNWKQQNKFNSAPCERLKQWLRENNIPFVEEFTPLQDRFFSLDIAFPDKLIGIEINGNQHYNPDGRLETLRTTFFCLFSLG